MFFGGGDPFEHFANMHGAGGPGGRGGRGGSVDNNEYYELLGKPTCPFLSAFGANALKGVSKDADENEIKKAYKKLALKNHPDKGGDVEKVSYRLVVVPLP